MSDKAWGLAGCLIPILWLVYGISQLVAGYQGIAFHFGGGWAVAALIASLVFRFPLPITIGSFFGAMDVWGWNWFLALIFAVPGLLFLIPTFMAAALGSIRGRSS